MNLLDSMISATILGHNFFILGQAGTGKSTLVRKIYGILTNAGKRVRTTETTGLASIRRPYDTTVHHLFGLLDGRYNSDQLKEKVSNNDSLHRIKETLFNTDTIINDDVSMLSKKSFEDVCLYLPIFLGGSNTRSIYASQTGAQVLGPRITSLLMFRFDLKLSS